METPKDIVDKVGGVRELARSLGRNWKSVHNWTRPGRRIPAEVWPSVAALPAAKKNKITLSVLASQRRPTPEAANV